MPQKQPHSSNVRGGVAGAGASGTTGPLEHIGPVQGLWPGEWFASIGPCWAVIVPVPDFMRT